MKLVVHFVLLAFAFLGGMALERYFKSTAAVEDKGLSVVAGPGLDLERGKPSEDDHHSDSNEHEPDDDVQGKPSLAHLLSLSEQRDKHRALDRVPPSELVAMLDELRESDNQSPQANQWQPRRKQQMFWIDWQR